MGDADQFYPLHQIRFRSRLHGVESRALAREIALRWTLPRRSDGSFDWGMLPPAAGTGSPFTARSSRGSVSVLQGVDSGLWLMRRDRIDPKVKGRIWRHEIYVADDGTADAIGVRLSAALGRNMVAPVQRSSVIATLVNNCGLLDDSTQVQTKPRTVTTYDVTPVMAMLTSPGRSLPVLLLDPYTSLEARHVAGNLAGFAHVLTVMPDAAPIVDHYIAKEMGIQTDAVTLCWPISAAAAGAAHRSWQRSQVKDPGFWPSVVAGVTRSSVGTMESWLGTLVSRLAR